MEKAHHNNRPSSEPPPLMRAIYNFLFQFLLPLLALGPLLYGAEKVAEFFGFHGTGTQFIRMIMLGAYVLVAFAIFRFKTPQDPNK